MTDQQFDVVVLGGGSAGYAAAIRATQLGKTAAVIEKDKLGGTCLHRGCVPTKAMLHSAEVADNAREAAQYGVNAEFAGIDISAVSSYRDGIVSSKFKGLQGLLKAVGVTVIAGEGKLVSSKAVEVDGQRISGKSIVLATGSYSKSLPGLELGGRVITSEQALKLDEVPKKVVILGGGVIGVEFASVWHSFGAEVTIVEGLPTSSQMKKSPFLNNSNAPTRSAELNSSLECSSSLLNRTTMVWLSRLKMELLWMQTTYLLLWVEDRLLKILDTNKWASSSIAVSL